MGKKLDKVFEISLLLEMADCGYATDGLLAKIMNETPPKISRYVNYWEERGFLHRLGFSKSTGRWKVVTGDWFRVTRIDTNQYPDVLARRLNPKSWIKDPRLKRSRIVCSRGEIVEDHDAALVATGAWGLSQMRGWSHLKVQWETAHRVSTLRGLNPLVTPEQAAYLQIGERQTGGSAIPDWWIWVVHETRPTFKVEVELSQKSEERYKRIADRALAPNGVPVIYVTWDDAMQLRLERIFRGCGLAVKIVPFEDNDALRRAVTETCNLFGLENAFQSRDSLVTGLP
jgi:hypothetical protein